MTIPIVFINNSGHSLDVWKKTKNKPNKFLSEIIFCALESGFLIMVCFKYFSSNKTSDMEKKFFQIFTISLLFIIFFKSLTSIWPFAEASRLVWESWCLQKTWASGSKPISP